MENNFIENITKNLRKIISDRGLTQETLADYAETSTSQLSKILNGTVKLSLKQLSKIATRLSMREIDIITYPDVYIKKEPHHNEPVEAILQLKLNRDKKDQVLKLVFGDNNLEIINK